MSNFPLYADLLKKVPKKDLTAKQKIDVINTIKNMDKSGREIVYALIRSHQLENTSDLTTNTLPPYSGYVTNGNPTFDFNDFPIPLRHILYKFANIQRISKKDDEIRDEKIRLVATTP
jgi:hypothetical protein